MMNIFPNIEAYGTYARRSALADALEVQAFSSASLSISRAELADYIRDSNWTRLLGGQFSLSDEEDAGLGEEIDASNAAALNVFDVLRERKEILGDRYPFAVSGERIRRLDVEGSGRAYCLFLAVTTLHAYHITTVGLDPRHYFEDLVTTSLARKGLVAGNLGRARRGSSGLAEAVYEVGRHCGLSPSPDSAIVRQRAQEEGVDVIAHLKWGDSRPLHWVFIVQATCGKSDTWYSKLHDASELMWKNLLGLRFLPRAVLAVPHHMQSDTASYLAEKGNGQKLVLDRLRLCEMDGDGIDRADDVMNALREIEVKFE